MVSFGPKLSLDAVTFLSAPISLPSTTFDTLTGGGMVVVVAAASVVGGGDGSLRPQATATSGSSSARDASLFMIPPAGSILGDLQFLAGKDLVRVLEHVLVGFEDPLPGVGVAVGLLGDL